MVKSPLVSVIMPLYNKRPYVKRSINSVINQTFTDWELIVVDDGSTDGSSHEIPSNEPRIRLFQQANAGPGSARNRGISMATGEYVTFLDADDYYYSNKLEQEMKVLHEDKSAEWMVSTYDYESGDVIKYKSFFDIEGSEITGKPVVFDEALKQLSISGWAPHGVCIKKYLLEEIGGFRESMPWMEITDFQIRCALAQPRVAIYTIPMFRVIDTPGSTSKIISHRINGMRQMGESLHRLSTLYPKYSDILDEKSKGNLLAYVDALIRERRNNKARKYLVKEFPYPRNKKWLKLWILSWIRNRPVDLKVKKTREIDTY